MSKNIRIAIVDHQPLYQGAVAGLLRRSGRFQIVASGDRARDAGQITAVHDVDALLIDLDVPGDGEAAVTEVIRAHPELRVVILTAADDEQQARRMLEAGACGYIVKSIEGQHLVGALLAACLGKGYLSPELAARLLTGPNQPAPQPQPALTDRDARIMSLLSRGKTNRQIATEVGLSATAVARHIAGWLDRLGAQDAAEEFATPTRHVASASSYLH